MIITKDSALEELEEELKFVRSEAKSQCKCDECEEEKNLLNDNAPVATAESSSPEFLSSL